MMLKMWFPHVARQPVDAPTQTITPQLPQHWCQNQLHMPVKVSFMPDVTFVTNRETLQEVSIHLTMDHMT